MKLNGNTHKVTVAPVIKRSGLCRLLEEAATYQMQKKIEELKKRRAKVMLGGGADKLEKQHKAGKLTARERIDALVDPDSFEETGLFAEHRATLFGMEGKEMPGGRRGDRARRRSAGGWCIWRARTSRWPADRPARCTRSRSPRS